MKIDEISSFWKIDSEIDRTDLGNESLKIPKLHHKYYTILVSEKLLLRSFESDMKKLKLDKYEFYSQGPSSDTPKDWRLPSKGIILKTEIPMYMEGDSDIIKLSLKIGLQQEKISLLEDIIKSINTRNYNIRNAIEFLKWTNGS